MSLYVMLRSHSQRTVRMRERFVEPRKKVKLEGNEHLKSKLKLRRRYSAPVKTQSPVLGFRGFPPPNGPSIVIMCWHCKRPGHYAHFCRAPIPPFNFGQALGSGGRFSKPILEFRADVSLNSSNCVNFSEDLSCKAEHLSLFNKSLISNESDDYKTLEPCVLSDVFDNSVHDQPKEPLVETFENVSDMNVKNRLTSLAQFWRNIGASPWVMRVIEQG